MSNVVLFLGFFYFIFYLFIFFATQTAGLRKRGILTKNNDIVEEEAACSRSAGAPWPFKSFKTVGSVNRTLTKISTFTTF